MTICSLLGMSSALETRQTGMTWIVRTWQQGATYTRVLSDGVSKRKRSTTFFLRWSADQPHLQRPRKCLKTLLFFVGNNAFQLHICKMIIIKVRDFFASRYVFLTYFYFSNVARRKKEDFSLINCLQNVVHVIFIFERYLIPSFQQRSAGWHLFRIH